MKGTKGGHAKEHIFIKSNFIEQKLPVFIRMDNSLLSAPTRSVTHSPVRVSIPHESLNYKLPKHLLESTSSEFQGGLTGSLLHSQIIDLKLENKSLLAQILDKNLELDRNRDKLKRYIQYIYIYIYRTEKEMKEVIEELHNERSKSMRKTKKPSSPEKGSDRRILELEYKIKRQENEKLYCEQVKAMLRDKFPELEELLQISLTEERGKVEEQNEKILCILRDKDHAIEEVGVRNEEQRREMREMEKKWEDMKSVVKRREIEIDEVENVNKKYVCELAENEETFRILNEEMRNYQEQIGEIEEELKEKRGVSAIVERMRGEMVILTQEKESKSEALKGIEDQLTYYITEHKRGKMKEEKASKLSIENERNLHCQYGESLEERDKDIIDLRDTLQEKDKYISTLNNQLADKQALGVHKISILQEEKGDLERRLLNLEDIYLKENLQLRDIISGQFGDPSSHEQSKEMFMSFGQLGNTGSGLLDQLRTQIQDNANILDNINTQKIDLETKLEDSRKLLHLRDIQGEQHELLTTNQYHTQIAKLQAELNLLQQKHNISLENQGTQTSLTFQDIAAIEHQVYIYIYIS